MRIFADPPRTKYCCQNYWPGFATDNKWKCCLIWPRNLLEASNQSCKGGATNSLNMAFSGSGPWTTRYGVVLQWVQSYLPGRFQLVKVNSVPSTPQLLFCVVPQCFVLGSLLSTMYTTTLSSIITAFGLEHPLYAGDTQIYTSFVAEDITQSLIVVQNCMLAIQD